MQTNRRNWLKKTALSVFSIGLLKPETNAFPAQNFDKNSLNDSPIRLSSNENPYGPSPLARQAMLENIQISNRYNWQLASDLVAMLAKKNHVAGDNILINAGSTEIIDLVVRHVALQKSSFIIADPSYAYWTDTAQKLGLQKLAVPLTADKKLDLPAMLKAVKPDTRLIYICNPNNPTGTICDRAELVEFINETTKSAIVLLDEAYIDFTEQESLSRLVIENENLIVAKTFSKIYGLAGARVGCAIAHKKTIEKLSSLQSWVNGNVSVASNAAALASLNDIEFVSKTYELNQKVKKFTIEQLENLNLKVIPSHSNFIYFSLENYKKDFFQQLKNNNIIGTRLYEEQGKWTRITVGTMEEMQKFITAIK